MFRKKENTYKLVVISLKTRILNNLIFEWYGDRFIIISIILYRELFIKLKIINCFNYCTCSLTTIGVERFSSFAAAIIPSAMTSHLMMPPNILTMMALT